jgi:hypothetical protein
MLICVGRLTMRYIDQMCDWFGNGGGGGGDGGTPTHPECLVGWQQLKTDFFL